MKHLMAAVIVLGLAACSQAPRKQPVTPLVPLPAPSAVPEPREQPAAVSVAEAPDNGLRDLEAVTLSCPKAALNAAAREAAKAPTEGTYQFAHFHIINDSHHASYEVRFKSNYQGEPELKYCVSMYCQQGWDPRTTRTSVRLLREERRRAGTAAHEAACGREHAPMNRRSKS